MNTDNQGSRDVNPHRVRDQGVNGKSNKNSKGASQNRTSIGDKVSSYFAHHRLVAIESLTRLLQSLIPSVMTWLVIGIAMALPAGLFVALGNIEQVSAGWDGAAQMSLFIDKSVSEQSAQQLATQLERRENIAEVEFISSEKALIEFQSLSGYGNVLQNLDENPLPAVIVVRPIENQVSAEATVKLFEELKNMPQVEQAVLDLAWVQRLYALMDLGRRISLALAGLLSLGVLLVIGNTIRLAIESRRDEIIIVKLVGATNAFVRRPFLYTGLWYGLGGGLMSWLIINTSLFWLSSPVAELAGLYQSQFELKGLDVAGTLVLWVSGGVLGLLGAWLAVSRHLGAIEPR